MNISQKFPQIDTNRLNLVEIRENHLEDLFTLFSDNNVTKYYNIKTMEKINEAKPYLDWFRNRYKEGLGIRWGIQIKGYKSIIGTIGFNNYTINHKANIGYDLHSEYWNKGYMTEAILSIIEFGFDTLKINRIEGEVMVGNINSERVLTKSGFTQEGILRDWMFWDDKHFDMIMYSILKKDYYKLHTILE